MKFRTGANASKFSDFPSYQLYRVSHFNLVGMVLTAFSNLSSIDDLWRGMQNLGVNLSKIEVEEMMQEADRDFDGKINFDEFIAMIRRT